MIISFASPPKPAIPSPFVTEPAASEATNVPWPTVSRTSLVRVRVLYATGLLAARSGALDVGAGVDDGDRHAAAARRTRSGTTSACVARELPLPRTWSRDASCEGRLGRLPAHRDALDEADARAPRERQPRGSSSAPPPRAAPGSRRTTVAPSSRGARAWQRRTERSDATATFRTPGAAVDPQATPTACGGTAERPSAPAACSLRRRHRSAKRTAPLQTRPDDAHPTVRPDRLE